MDDTGLDDTARQELHALARATAHPEGAAGQGKEECCSCPVALLADRADGTVVRHGAVVLKAHAPGGGAGELPARVAVATRPALADVLLPPLPALPHLPSALDGRPLTAWPYGTPVDPDDPAAAPWEAAARLLALLHRTPPPPGLPAMRAPLKAAHAVERMRRAAPGHPAAATVLRAWRTLPEPGRAGDRAPGGLCHGDFHLGQLVRAPHWRLIDVDDLGLGDPAWDLARPAAWFAAGLLAPEVWTRFLGMYEAAGGPATGRAGGGAGDPWARLDLPARALTVQTAALALAKSAAEGRPLDEVEHVMIDTCERIASL